MPIGKELHTRDWYFGFQCANEECRQFFAVFEFDNSRPFDVKQSDAWLLVECPHCHADGRYPLEAGYTLQVSPVVRPVAGRRAE